MAASFRPSRARARRGSLDRPVNGRMYRGTWLLVGLPLLVAAFSVGSAQPLPAPTVPPTFDGEAALALARDFTSSNSFRPPGSLGPIRWVSDRFALYGFRVQRSSFDAEVPGLGAVRLTNLFAVASGPSPQAPVIVVMAHRDAAGIGRGANDNASGTAALLELARPYAPAPGGTFGAVAPAHTLVFLSTDGGAFGGIGAARFAQEPAFRNRIVAVVNLDTIGGPGSPRLELAADAAASPPATLVQTAADRLVDETGREPRRPHPLWQLVDLGFPFSLYEQAPLIAAGVPAITITTADERPPPSIRDSAPALSRQRLEQVGRAAQRMVSSIDQGLDLPAEAGAYIYFGPRLLPGWAVQLVLVTALLPFLAAAVDLFARCRRRRIPLAPALRSLRSRLAFWLFVGALFALFALAGAWPGGASRPLSPESDVVREWPLLPIVLLVALGLLAWLVPRERLIPRRPVHPAERIAGYTAALLALGVLALVVVAVNAYALVFLLPSLHAWLWLPQLGDRPLWARLLVLLAGLGGPALLLTSFATRLDLGVDAPWYVLSLVSVGYVEPLVGILALVWAAAAAQLAAVAAGRYAPYPDAAERPARGPLRELVRRTALAIRNRDRAPAEDVRALER